LNNVPLAGLTLLIILYFFFNEGIEEVPIIFSCLGLSFVLSSLSLMMAGHVHNDLRKVYRDIGRLLFHSTILFSFALSVNFFIYTLDSVIPQIMGELKIIALTIIYMIFKTSFFVILFFAVLEFFWALHNLNAILFKELFLKGNKLHDQWQLKV
jgi:hypothetical protein